MSTTERPIKVFFCHAPSDTPKVRELYRFLKQRGVQAWLEEEHLLPGQNRQFETAKAIRQSEAIIICLSASSVGKEGSIHKDIKFALDRAMEMPEGRIFIIPAKLDECELPYSLRDYSSVDLFHASGYEKLMKAFAARIETGEVEPTNIEPSSTTQQQAAERSIQVEGNARENIFITGDHANLQMGEHSRPIINLRPIKTDRTNQLMDEEINCVISSKGVIFPEALTPEQYSTTFLYSFSVKNIGKEAGINLIPTLTIKGKSYKGRVLASLSPNERAILHFIVNMQHVYIWTISGRHSLSITYSGLNKAYTQTYLINIDHINQSFELDLNGNTVHPEE